RVRWVSGSLPVGVRHVRGLALVRARARRADVVYTTGMFGRSSAGALAAQRPYVVKLTADPAFERSRRRGLVAGDVDEFQAGGGGALGFALRRGRGFELRRAAYIYCPSPYLRRLPLRSGGPSAPRWALPNPVPMLGELPEAPRNGHTLAFAGRLTAQKSLGRALEAVAGAEGVRFVVAGEGPDRPALEQRARELGIDDRVEFLGAQPRQRVVELFRSADATTLSSSWENFPHTVVEALAVGTPVLAMEAGGVGEVVRDGVNGLLVPAGDAAALAAAVRRYFSDDGLRERLRRAAAPSVAAYAPERVFGELESTLRRVAQA